MHATVTGGSCVAVTILLYYDIIQYYRHDVLIQVDVVKATACMCTPCLYIQLSMIPFKISRKFS